MSQELKPCPFCHQQKTLILIPASQYHADDDDEGSSYSHSETYAVMCDASSPGGPGGCGASSGFKPTEAEAVTLWNRRHEAQQPAVAQGAGEVVVAVGEVAQFGDDIAGHLRGYLYNPLPVGTKLYTQPAADADPLDAKRFTKDVPTEQGWYWHWNGDEECHPIPTSVLWSGCTQSCFVSRGQLGLSEAVYCDKYGGYWLKMTEPLEAIDAAIAASGRQP